MFWVWGISEERGVSLCGQGKGLKVYKACRVYIYNYIHIRMYMYMYIYMHFSMKRVCIFKNIYIYV